MIRFHPSFRLSLSLWAAIVSFAIVLISNQAQAQVPEKILHTFVGAGDGKPAYSRLIRAKNGSLYGTSETGGYYGQGTIFRLGSSGKVATIFSFNGIDGALPLGALYQGKDGKLYSTTSGGGETDQGTVFTIDTDGTNFASLHSFSPPDGMAPEVSVIQGTDGRLYGTTATAGPSSGGTVFALNTDGSGFAVLYGLGSGLEGAFPQSQLLQGFDGRLYGETASAVFAINTDGSGIVALHQFSAGDDGYDPDGGIAQAGDGRLYGTAEVSGANGQGSVFAMNADGTNFETLHAFGGLDGANPASGVVIDKAGELFGTTYCGGTDWTGQANSGSGTVFAVDKDGSGFTTLDSLSGENVAHPESGLVRAGNGKLYGTAIAGGGAYDDGAVFDLDSDGSGFSDLYDFHESETSGVFPVGGLMQIPGRGFCGTTNVGGQYNLGELYLIDRAGRTTVLHDFSGEDGSFPSASVILGSDGRLYGTTSEGGIDYDGNSNSGSGVAFAVNPDGSGFVVLHSFIAGDGQGPQASLIEGSDGRLYGTTEYGGPNGVGTVFAMNLDGSGYVALHDFAGVPEGRYPQARLVQGTDGRLYGPTANGGANDVGSLFALNTDGSGFITIQSCTLQHDAFPAAGLLQGKDGRLYGAAEFNDLTLGGTVFAINTDGTGFATLHAFSITDGAGPTWELVQAADGTLYGTTSSDGPNGGGTAFSVSPTGNTFTTLYAFPSALPGQAAGLYARLMLSSDGNLFGITL